MKTPVLMKAALICFVLLFSGLSLGDFAEAADKENCLMCHKYRFLGRIDENGKQRNYHVDETMYAGSLHHEVGCRDCHTDITKIPHDPVTEQVNCANVCHITTPFAREKFSHQQIVDTYNSSVHGIKPEDGDVLKQAKPNCKFCHLNPLYSRIPEEIVNHKKALERCINCHKEKGVMQAYRHITHRVREKTSRSSEEIVALCAKCHQDTDLMQQLDVTPQALTAVATYKRTVHGRAVELGSKKAADCISCHASAALHDIYKKGNPQATIHKNRLKETCRQCHEQSNDWFIKIAVHPTRKKEENPVIYLTNLGLRTTLYGTVSSLMGLLVLETFGRRRDGIKFLLRRGTSWRGKSRRTAQQPSEEEV